MPSLRIGWAVSLFRQTRSNATGVVPVLVCLTVLCAAVLPQVRRRSREPRPRPGARPGPTSPAPPVDDREELNFQFDEELEKVPAGGRNNTFTEDW